MARRRKRFLEVTEAEVTKVSPLQNEDDIFFPGKPEEICEFPPKFVEVSQILNNL